MGHTAAPASNILRYAIDSGLTSSLRDLAPRFEHRIFLSATPNNGHSNSFTALLELLDPAVGLNAERYGEEQARGLQGKGAKKGSGQASQGGSRQGRPRRDSQPVSGQTVQIGLAL